MSRAYQSVYSLFINVPSSSVVMFDENNSVQSIQTQYKEDNQSLYTETVKTWSFLHLSEERTADVGTHNLRNIYQQKCRSEGWKCSDIKLISLTVSWALCKTRLSSSNSVSKAVLSSLESSANKMKIVQRCWWRWCTMVGALSTSLTEIHFNGFYTAKVFVNLESCVLHTSWTSVVHYYYFSLILSSALVCLVVSQGSLISTSQQSPVCAGSWRCVKDQQVVGWQSSSVSPQPAGMLLSFPSTPEPHRRGGPQWF